MASQVNAPVPAHPAVAEPAGQTAKTAEPLGQTETFLKLLIAQIRNQNPLNPANGIEFLTQLAQFSQLEQILQIRAELEAIHEALAPEAPGAESNKGDQ